MVSVGALALLPGISLQLVVSKDDLVKWVKKVCQKKPKDKSGGSGSSGQAIRNAPPLPPPPTDLATSDPAASAADAAELNNHKGTCMSAQLRTQVLRYAQVAIDSCSCCPRSCAGSLPSDFISLRSYLGVSGLRRSQTQARQR